jgi:ADP-heptose:LPS heptosyltransferase
MAAGKPILILQMQRMGDLILSFPLFLWLKREYGDRPLWVVAEERFYKDLMPVSPEAVYFPWSEQAVKRLAREEFELVLNLSHRPEAAELARDAKSAEKLGPVAEGGGVYVRGAWQLYRTALTRNNLFNRFHWAELNALDVAPGRIMETRLHEPRTLPPKEARVGLFLGASQEDKRPSAKFWIELSRQLLDRGLNPVLLGGPGEISLAAEVVRGVRDKLGLVNYAGKLSLAEIAASGQAMHLMITPDTGPMHLAAWTGVKTLNLSMGNVNARETGPHEPGHFVLRSAVSCYGCWECTRPEALCRGFFRPEHTAWLAHTLVRGREKALHANPGRQTVLYRTGRSGRGLYDLKYLGPPRPKRYDEALSAFWQEYFGHALGLWDEEGARKALSALAAQFPEIYEILMRSVADISRELGKALAAGGASGLDADFWNRGRRFSRPLRGYCQMYLENNDYSEKAWRDALGLLELMISLAP